MYDLCNKSIFAYITNVVLEFNELASQVRFPCGRVAVVNLCSGIHALVKGSRTVGHVVV